MLSLRGCCRPEQCYCSPGLVVFTQRVSWLLLFIPLATWLTVTASHQHWLLTYGLDQSGAGGLDHHVRVQQDSLQQGLGEGGQLGDQRGEPEVDAESIVRKVAYPEH